MMIRTNRTFVWTLALGTLLLGGTVQPAAGQGDLGLALSLADTETNAVGLGGTLNLYPLGPLAVRVYADLEWAWQNFKPGLGYEEPDRLLIVDEFGNPRDPRTKLWDWPGFDVHVSGYVTQSFGPYVSAGAGYAYNGHDGTSDVALLLIGHLTSIAELDLEFLGGGSWRMRLSVALVSWP